MEITEYLLNFYVEQNGETISQELAEGLVHSMTPTDDRVDGQKWSMSECKEIGDKVGVDWSEVLIPEWFCVMNMMYSDYCEVFRKHGINDPLIYGEMSKAWFEDADGKKNKTFKYFFNC